MSTRFHYYAKRSLVTPANLNLLTTLALTARLRFGPKHDIQHATSISGETVYATHWGVQRKIKVEIPCIKRGYENQKALEFLHSAPGFKFQLEYDPADQPYMPQDQTLMQVQFTTFDKSVEPVAATSSTSRLAFELIQVD